MNQEEQTFADAILTELRLLWHDTNYTREHAAEAINDLAQKYSLTEKDVKVKVKSLGGEDGFSVDVKIH